MAAGQGTIKLTDEEIRNKYTFVPYDNVDDFITGMLTKRTEDKRNDLLKTLTSNCKGNISSAYIDYLLDDEKNMLFVGVTEKGVRGTPVGFSIVKQKNDTEVDLPLICANAPGLGKVLLNETERLLKEAGITIVNLQAVSNVIGFYEKQGYTYVMLAPEGYERKRDVYMQKNLGGKRSRKSRKNGFRRRKTMRRRR